MALHLYNITLQKPTAITLSIEGNFSEPKAKELVVARGRILELFRFDKDLGRLVSIYSQDVFGIIRDIIPFRLTAGNKDYIVVGSDSGRINILEFDTHNNKFIKIHEETFGRSGCRRIVPGQYVASDPRGRAVMIGAIEKQKFVYIINRDNVARLTISSPLEAHKSRTICFDIIGVDVGFENPIFAAIEVDYEEQGEDDDIKKYLTFYELDLGLNHVVRKWSDPIDPTANKLISVPGGRDGPGGVLVCAENFIYWKNMDHEDIHSSIPRRFDMDESRGLLFISYALFKRRDLFFFLIQSEYGDLYKVDLHYKDDSVSGIQLSYFDSISPSISLSIISPAFLFSAAESGNHSLYQFIGTGDDNDDNENDMKDSDFELFKPRSLKNLELLENLDNLSPLVNMQIKDIAREATNQLYTLCGTGTSSSLRILRHGLEATEVANSALPGNPSNIWTVRKTLLDKYDCYIVISFTDSTLVLSIGESIEEASEESSGFLLSSPTLFVRQLGDDGVLQVLPTCVRFISHDKTVSEWKTPGKKQIIHATANQKQVVISLTGGELYYFQLDESNTLIEIAKKEMLNEVSCIDVAPIASGRVSSRFLAVADWDKTIRILSLDMDGCLQTLTYQALPSQPVALSLILHNDSSLYLNVGLQDGVLLRIGLDPHSGDLSDVRRRFLGVRPVKLIKLSINNEPALLALSSRAWLSYNYQNRIQLTPLSFIPAECASGFSSEHCPEGLVITTENSLRIITIERLGEIFNSQEIQLKYTPRSFALHKPSNNIIIIESEHNTKSESKNPETDENIIIQRPKAGTGQWASCIRLFNGNEGKTLDFIELENNEAAMSISTCIFHDHPDEVYIIVGTVKDLQFTPRKIDKGYIHVYRIIQDKDNKVDDKDNNDSLWKFEFVHKTEVEDIPAGLCTFQGRLLVGVGKMLRIYDLGKRKLLRKCENRQFPRLIKAIHTQGNRIIVGDISESFFYVKYRRYENQLLIFADDTAPRWITSSCVLDYNTVAGGDKFGNIFVARLPKEIAENAEEDPTAAHLQNLPYKGAPHKIVEIIQFHVGEVVTHLSKSSLIPGGASNLIYATIHGAIGALVPFVAREDIDFFSMLEMHMRQTLPPLCGRDHMSFRSYYFPVKGVVDGDLCEQFVLLEPLEQEKIAEELGKTTREILKKLEDIRNRCL